MKIITNKNKKEEEILRKKTQEFKFTDKGIIIGKQIITRKELNTLINSMRDEMRKANGVGLSANQIGLSYRLFVAEVPDHQGNQKFYAILNPKIEKIEQDSVTTLNEGCLSVPESYGLIDRATQVKISGLTKTGKSIKIKAWGLLAQVFQHEIDHLDGKLFIDKAKEIHKTTKLEIDKD